MFVSKLQKPQNLFLCTNHCYLPGIFSRCVPALLHIVATAEDGSMHFLCTREFKLFSQMSSYRRCTAQWDFGTL